MKKTRYLALRKETLQPLEPSSLHAALGGSLETGATHVTVSNTVSTVGSGSCRV